MLLREDALGQPQIASLYSQLFYALVEAMLPIHGLQGLDYPSVKFLEKSVAPDSDFYKRAMKNVEHLREVAEQLTPEESTVITALQKSAWVRLRSLVERLKSDSSLEEQTAVAFIEAVSREDPSGMVHRVLPAVLEDFVARPLSDQQAAKLKEMVQDGCRSLHFDGKQAFDTTPEALQRKITDEIKFEELYRKAIAVISEIQPNSEDALDAVSAVNRAMALVGSPSTLEPSLFALRARLWAAIGVVPFALVDTEIACNLLPGEPGS